MRGTIFDIKRYAVHDGPGIRTTVFLKGCNLHCRWCHNPESQALPPSRMWQTRRLGDKEFRQEVWVGYSIAADDLMSELLKDRIFYEESGGGVTFSGGEPLLQAPFLLEMLKRCRANGLHTCVDTAGSVVCESLAEICSFTDLFLYDLKTARESVFTEYVGAGFHTVFDNLQIVAQSGTPTILRIPVIPGVNDMPEEVDALIDALRAYPSMRRIGFMPFHRLGADKYERLGRVYPMSTLPAMKQEELAPLKETFFRAGFTIE